MKRHLDRFPGLIFAGLLLLCASAHAQTAVVLAPVPQLQFFDQSGRPLSFGCVFTYEVASTTPLSTYTDYTGTVLNTDPVILSAGGSANIWLIAGQAYTFTVKSAGGTNCASGSTLYTVDGIGGGSSTQTVIVPVSPTPSCMIAAQIQLCIITLTANSVLQPLTFVGVTPPGILFFQIIQDASGGHSFSWAANSIGGCTVGSAANQTTTQEFVYNGTDAVATGPCVTGNGPSIVAGQITFVDLLSACVNSATSGTIRLCKTDTILWRNNANGANMGIGIDASDRGLLGWNGGTVLAGTTANLWFGGVTSSFPMLKQNSAALNVRLGDDSGDAALTASTLALSGLFTSTNATAIGLAPAASTPSAPASGNLLWYVKAGHGLCAEDSSANEYCTGINSGSGAIYQQFTKTLGSPISVSTSTPTTILTQAVTMPSVGCPCRAFVSWGIDWESSAAGVVSAWMGDGTSTFATGWVGLPGSVNSGMGLNASAYSTGTAYANGASLTFTLTLEEDTGATFNVQSTAQFGAGQATWMNVAIFASN